MCPQPLSRCSVSCRPNVEATAHGSVNEGEGSVSVYYRYATVTVAQLFKFKGSKIAEALVVFDARGFGTDARM